MGSLNPPLPGQVCSSCGHGDLCLEESLALLEDKDQDPHCPARREGHRGQGALGPNCELRGQLIHLGIPATLSEHIPPASWCLKTQGWGPRADTRTRVRTDLPFITGQVSTAMWAGTARLRDPRARCGRVSPGLKSLGTGALAL